MIKKIIILLGIVTGLIFSFQSSAQPTQCDNINGDFESFNTPTVIANDNPWINNSLDNWYVSHGTPSTMVSPTNHMWMWSYYHKGEGVFTLYPFDANEIYEVSYKLWMDATSNPISQFRVELSNGLIPFNGTSPSTPTPVGNQSLTTQAWLSTNTWLTITETFTASQNYSQLWFYPYLSDFGSTGQAACRIDDICIQKVDDPCEIIKHSTIEVAGTDPFTFNVSGLPNDLYEFLGFNWDFGDGNTASGLSVSHDYSLDVVGPGSITYTVCLTVYYFDPTTSQCCHEVICTDVVIEPSDPIDPIDDGGGVAGG